MMVNRQASSDARAIRVTGDSVRRPGVVGASPFRPAAPVLNGLVSSRVAPLRLRLAVELATWHMIDAPLPRVGGEVALDRIGRRARPRLLGRYARASLPRGFLCLLRLRLRLSWRACQTILVVGTGGTMPGVSAHIAPRVRGATVPAVAARAVGLGKRSTRSEHGHGHQECRRTHRLQFRPARRSASSVSTAASCGVTHRSNTTPQGQATVSR